MLGKKYIKIDNVAINNPTRLRIKRINIENTLVSEAGFDMTDTTRLMKRVISCSFNCSSFFHDQLVDICQQGEAVVKIGNGSSFNARIRMNSDDVVEDSEMVQGTDGLWQVSVTISEK